MPAQIHVAVAVIINQKNEVLISLRAKDVHQGGLWEFPGGKLEAGESVLDALRREVKEELNLCIVKTSAFKKIHHQYSDRTVLLDIWRVDSFTGEPRGAEGQQIKWQAIADLNDREFPAANRDIIMSLQLPQRYLITGSFENHQDFKSKLETSLNNGISLVQLRCKNMPADEYRQLAEASILLCEKYNAMLLFNTTQELFTDIRRNCTAKTGLHLSSKMLEDLQTRPVDNNALLSVSCHTDKEIEKAKLLNADIVLLSPVKETRSHPGIKGIGWQKFSDISSTLNTPVYALGGMSAADLADAKVAGAQGVAAISSFWG